MADPVVDLELDPGAGEHVERRRRLEVVAGEELAADGSRVRLEQVRSGSGRVRSSGTLRPKRVPIVPMAGLEVVVVPSTVRVSCSAAVRGQARAPPAPVS